MIHRSWFQKAFSYDTCPFPAALDATEVVLGADRLANLLTILQFNVRHPSGREGRELSAGDTNEVVKLGNAKSRSSELCQPEAAGVPVSSTTLPVPCFLE